MTTTVHAYRGPAWWSLRHLRDAAHDAGVREVVAAWLCLGVAAVAATVLDVDVDHFKRVNDALG